MLHKPAYQRLPALLYEDGLSPECPHQPWNRTLHPIPHTPPTPVPEIDLKALERMNRVNVLSSVMRAEASIAKQWLNYRYPSERNIRIDFRAESKERGWFASGEQIHATLEVNIW